MPETKNIRWQPQVEMQVRQSAGNSIFEQVGIPEWNCK